MRVSVGHLCQLFGVSRQAFYHRQHHAQRVRGHSLLVLDLVLVLRREIPGLCTRKLHFLLQQPLAVSGIKIGRDQLHQLLQTHNLILRQKRSVPKTTNSAHTMRKYPKPVGGYNADGTTAGVGVRHYVLVHWARLWLFILVDRCVIEAHRRLLLASTTHGGGLPESVRNGPAKRAALPGVPDLPLGPGQSVLQLFVHSAAPPSGNYHQYDATR